MNISNVTINVKKRNGNLVTFDSNKIKNAMAKAFDECKQVYNEETLNLLLLRVMSKFTSREITVEQIQDIVENVLIEAQFTDVAKAYILYRERHATTRDLKNAGGELVARFLNEDVVRGENGNASVTANLGGLILHNSEEVTRDYYLNHVYDPDVKKAHENREFHIHDLGFLSGYCAGWSLKQLIQEGIGGVEGKITSAPAAHLSTLCNQMVNFLGIMQNEWAG